MVTVIIYKLFEQAVANKQQVTFAKFADSSYDKQGKLVEFSRTFSVLTL